MGRAIVNRTEVIRQAQVWADEAIKQEHNVFMCIITGQTMTTDEYYMYCMFQSQELLSTISKQP
jgi:hypothetical protein